MPRLFGYGAVPSRSRDGAWQRLRARGAGAREVSGCAVPLGRARDSFLGADSRRISEEPRRLRGVEFAMMGEESHAPAVERRVDAQRDADGFAKEGGRHHGPHGNAPSRLSYAERVGDIAHDFVQRRRSRPCEDEYLAERRIGCAAEKESVDEVVDVHHVQFRRAAADHDEGAAGHCAVELQEPQISLTVNGPWAHDDNTLAATRGRRGGELSFELGALVDVAGPEGVALARRRMGDVT